ncbi:hypothetical protein GCM10027406_14210 [Leifsonia lichenia]
MPWWSWVVIWVVLVLGLLGMLAYFAVQLFRKLMAAGREASALIAKTDVLSRRVDDLNEAAFHPAALADVSVLRAEREQTRADKAVARQLRRDARVRRGKLLVNADPRRYTYLIKKD